ncbi:MAG: hypothetical protein ACYCPP_09710 [Nitrososphaerales archaeon]
MSSSISTETSVPSTWTGYQRSSFEQEPVRQILGVSKVSIIPYFQKDQVNA